MSANGLRHFLDLIDIPPQELRGMIEASGAMVICGHDAAQWATLRKGADAYE